MTDREKLAARIRALADKTVANGCTEAEAMAAAELLAKLLAQYNMTMEEAELRESPFERSSMKQDDWVGDVLWVVADGISQLTGARYWKNRPGFANEISFFGFRHEVEVARYLLQLCARAMETECLRHVEGLRTNVKRRRAARPFLDGMASRLRERLLAMRPPRPTGTGIIVLHDQLVAAALKDAGINLGAGRGHMDLEAFAGHALGVAAADRVAINPGIEKGPGASPQGLLK